jgi:hypothetical protein
MTATPGKNSFTLLPEGTTVVEKIREILKSPYAKEYIGTEDTVACETAINQITNGTAHDPQSNFFRIHAILTHNQQHSISCEKILEKGMTFTEVKNRARLLMEIDDTIQLLKKNSARKQLFEWDIPQA